MTTALSILDRLVQFGVVPVIRMSSAEYARTAVEWLSEAGFGTFEITLTTPGAMDLIAEFSARGDRLIGAGTVMTAEAVAEAVAAGARYVVSPCVVSEVGEACRELGIACLMGALTPTEIHQALAAGAAAVKIFPASTVGPAHLKAMRSVFPGVSFMPTGGLDADNVGEWLKAGAACIGAGGKLVDEGLVARGDKAAIQATARRMQEAYATARKDFGREGVI
ncbi:bifunctional 4-hydroxy-2-oxoglutarate aldolase/2-dehydro-3-deoxy-phosphogluconate aldolase [Telmatospirillum sp. J64-1]|uniref:bifunctional 4-hydroxy-2-oxoglutarate aldolase/2-dehydro-3-deoxy-phosphogluconate aldolase n=1 Tax=Telmatospirillum sp. J64-1 TaxID=2502183 RepID=UPI00115CFB44|nr:bifunctional 4-hydroxy-2-oxoglutarate aldolase/2-dehydro-3-deoxy-phosphogluconate aldolase [Telmatospirillum sp. J64-1]